jgi:hypothetical protein
MFNDLVRTSITGQDLPDYVSLEHCSHTCLVEVNAIVPHACLIGKAARSELPACLAEDATLRYDDSLTISAEVFVHTLSGRRFWLLIGLCVLLAALVLLLMPAEKTIGPVIKVVYLHGALSRAGMLGFILAGLLGLAYLIRPVQPLGQWSRALLMSGWAFWAAHFLVSMPATRLTWGPWVAWGEPRVTMTIQILAAGLVVILVSWLLKDLRFAAAANLLFAIAFVVLAALTGVLRHPLDPIGSSPSTLLRLAYLALLLPIAGCMLLVAWRLTVSSLLRPDGLEAAAPDRLEA